mmetsp:Transcript_17328/g.15247  ORF Transcript_17328/g.15247 Transcript_17328/m.15247 type:complete len:102 (+) Transcript_17328:118-423(+)
MTGSKAPRFAINGLLHQFQKINLESSFRVLNSPVLRIMWLVYALVSAIFNISNYLDKWSYTKYLLLVIIGWICFKAFSVCQSRRYKDTRLENLIKSANKDL